MRRLDPNTIKYTNLTCRTVGRRNQHAGMMLAPATSLSATPSFVALSSATVWGLSALVFTANAHIVIPNVMLRPAPNTIKYTNCTCRTVGRRNQHAGTMLAPATSLSATPLSATPSFVVLSSATVWAPFTLVFTANAHIVIPNVMLRPAPNTIKYTNCTCRTVGRRNQHAGTMLAPATSLSATSLSATHSFVALSSATVWGLSVLVFTANAHIVIPNVMRRLDPNTIKYTNCICRILGRRNRHAGTTPSSAVVRPPFTFRRSYRRRHRLVSFSSKSFRFGDVAALPIRSPRSVTDEYWYVASAAPIVRRSGGRVLPFRAGCGEVRESIIAIRRLFAGRSGNLTIRRLRRTAPCGGVAGGQLRYTPQIALNTTPEQRTRYLKLQ